MDRKEKLEYEKGIEQYFDDNKVYDLFEKLFKELLVNRPEDPLDYLIARLKLQDTKRIFITGYSGIDRKSISLAITNNFGYTCLNMENLIEREISKKLENASKLEKNFNENRLVDDEIAINLVKDQLIKEEKIFEKLRERFPLPPEKNDEGQQDQHSVESDSNQNNYKTDEQLKEMAKISIEESEMNIEAVKDVFSGFYCEIPVDKYNDDSEIVNELAKMLSFKNKTNAARRPPRIILSTPPCMDKNGIAEKICNELRIIHVNIIDLLKKEIQKKMKILKLFYLP